VRATGGLDDTIEQWNPNTGRGTGFKFAEYSGEALLDTIYEALQAYKDQPRWQQLMRNGMMCDFSWDASAREYVKIYERVKGVRVSSEIHAAERLAPAPVPAGRRP